MNLRDTFERLVWTFIAAAGGALVAPELFDVNISALQAAGIAGLAAVVNAVTVIARSRLAVLPDPGNGLPGFTIGSPGQGTTP